MKQQLIFLLIIVLSFITVGCNGSGSSTGNSGDTFLTNEASTGNSSSNKIDSAKCPEGFYYNNTKLQCLTICDPGHTYSIEKKMCVEIPKKDGDPCGTDRIYMSSYKNTILKGCVDRCNFDKGEIFDVNSLKCHLPCKNDEIFEGMESRCIPICQGNTYRDKKSNLCITTMPLLIASDEISILSDLIINDRGPLKICLYYLPEIEKKITSSDEKIIIDNIKNALSVWLGPLRTTISKKLQETIIIERSNKYCREVKNKLAGVIIHEGDDNISAVVYKEFAISINYIRRLSSYIHEFGHLFGFDDHYEQNRCSYFITTEIPKKENMPALSLINGKIFEYTLSNTGVNIQELQINKFNDTIINGLNFNLNAVKELYKEQCDFITSVGGHINDIRKACIDGYAENTTVMCASDDQLKPADVEAIKKRYCRFYPDDPKCSQQLKKLTDLENGKFLSCNDKNTGETVSFAHDYNKLSIEILKKVRGATLSEEFFNLQFSEEVDSFAWNVIDTNRTTRVNELNMNLIGNKISINLINEEGINRTFDFAIFDITNNGTKIKWNCEFKNTLLKYRLYKKLKEIYPQIISW
ncbi:MAG: hypothetical protein HQK49_13125 [Oligoflexia bacterium]|nr:hypothetical protein [Oligoflexia bacterium]